MASVQEIVDQKKFRAERFGTDSSISEDDKRKLRSARFASQEPQDALNEKIDTPLADIIKADQKSRQKTKAATKNAKVSQQRNQVPPKGKKVVAKGTSQRLNKAPPQARNTRGAAAPRMEPVQTSRERGLRAPASRAPRADRAPTLRRGHAVSRLDAQETPARRGRASPRTSGTQFGTSKRVSSSKRSDSSLALIDPAEHQRREDRKAKFAAQ